MKTAIGLMSGTSMDGIDIALLRTDGESVIEFGPTQSVSFESSVRFTIEQALEDARHINERTDRSGTLKDVETLITELHARAVKQFLDASEISAMDVDLLGFHGQTVVHRPDEGLTVQLGNGAALAKMTGIDVIYDFRYNDMQHGGQGAPLVPVFHKALGALSGTEGNLVFVNIGGISNITFMNGSSEPIAFDSGPGNALIDMWVQDEAGIPFDQGGHIASEGGVNEVVLKRYLN